MWALKHNKTGNFHKNKHCNTMTIYTKKSLALINTWDFPNYHVVKVTIEEQPHD